MNNYDEDLDLEQQYHTYSYEIELLAQDILERTKDIQMELDNYATH